MTRPDVDFGSPKTFRGTIILARHGETVSNSKGLILGQSDSPLSERGTSESHEIAQLIRLHNIDAVFSSALGRAISSAKIYVGNATLPIFARSEIAELSCGSWEGTPRKEKTDDTLTIRKSWSDKPPGGESYGDGEIRVSRFIDELLSSDPSRRILIVGHGSLNRVFLKLWLNLTADHAMRIRCPHNLIYVIQSGKVVAWDTNGLIHDGFLLEDRQPGGY